MTYLHGTLALTLGLTLALGRAAGEDLMPQPSGAEPTVLLRPQAPPNRLDNLLQSPPPAAPTRSLLPTEPIPGEGLPPLPKAPERLIQPWKFDLTFLPEGGNTGFGILDLEGAVTFRVPIDGHLPPLLITPGLGIHLWNGPDRFFPGSDNGRLTLYDLYVDFGWRPRLAEWLFIDLGITPGIYSDLKKVTTDSFLLRGRAVGIFAFSESFQIVAGLLYVNRLNTDIIPALGFMWTPSEDTKLQLVFPQPKVSHRFHCANGVEWWGYVAGDFGGGTWTVKRDSDHLAIVDYRDWRFLVGMEAITQYDLHGRIEAGVAFNRRFEFDSWWRTAYEPDSAFILRFGLTY
jgi:hypothetical protein